jgi:hypothetical protein
MIFKRPKRLKNNVLPPGYYSVEGNSVRLKDGPYRGVTFNIGKIKIRQEVLTNAPQLLYDYEITQNGSFDPDLLKSDPNFSRIIAAIIVDEFNDTMGKGSLFESIECHNQD